MKRTLRIAAILLLLATALAVYAVAVIGTSEKLAAPALHESQALSMYGKAIDGPGADPSYTPPPGAAARYEAYLRAHRPGPPPDPALFVEPDPSDRARELRNPEARANRRQMPERRAAMKK